MKAVRALRAVIPAALGGRPVTVAKRPSAPTSACIATHYSTNGGRNEPI